MSDGRTVWWPKDSAWWRRETVVELGEEFGPAGPAVLDWLSCEAKAQNDGGRVKAGVRSCARGVFCDAATVSHVLSRAVALGALDDYEEAAGRFTARISGWRKDNERGQAAARKAAERERRSAGNPDATGDHTHAHLVTDRDSSRPVTPGHLTGQDKPSAEAEGGSESARPRRAVDQDALPDGLDARLAALVPDLLAVLAEVQSQRGGAVPTVRGVGLAVKAFPRRDHAAVMRELEFWALAGRGQRKPVKDWAATYRTFLGNAVDADPVRPAVAGAAPVRPLSEREQRTAARLERARAAGLVGGALLTPSDPDTIEGSVVDAAA